MNYECPKCLGDGFAGWHQSTFRNKKRVYKKICPVCLGSGETDWISNITINQPKITDSLALINDILSRKLGNYCFSIDHFQTYFINEEFSRIKDLDKKWIHVRKASMISV